MTDQLKKYLFDDHSTRVQTVKLGNAWQTGLAHQHYPECIQRLLGELTSAAVLLASNLKFDGSLVLQLQGDGPVALIVVECSADLNIRATATLREGHAIPADGTLQSLLNAHGQGRFIVVLDPNRDTTDMQPYQGVVPLEGDTVAQVLELYMRNSEQLDTRIWLAADAVHSAGLLLQRLPGQGGNAAAGHDAETESTWERAGILAATLKPAELLDLDSDAVIHRLFWEETLIAFPPQDIRWWCPCTRERVADMLRILGRDEVESILSEREHIDVSCNFCGKPYRFDAVDCAALFTQHINAAQDGSQSLH
ncbi:Hsp33 family molecular chaperone HslO [Eoetvoesiella caeni]|uniref:Molecular chaperone Hsp33 n=1 Tax=Eoetvoesiella caeni TaxID=645616 RepID=A0A366HMJ0_9BURK|nr:Hsp33 family molecular chaperone HslO [Eoetvoesiella caeni]MCI2807168.1 Hsp33 family molecular chaperone HslO [Eoetvoesiella caeni]NYT53435.1 Hsp33 family molecular chaperone HslO [Eoetvoesiella caeni]RBP43421.1 molecular chaperone Hsp33 [Eoetvoesiella caeni]